MKKEISWEERNYKPTVKKIVVNFPVYYIDEYGYYNYSPNENETVEIGPNGTQSNKKGTHSIKHTTYFSGERYARRKKDITLNEWREALNNVLKYVQSQMEATL